MALPRFVSALVAAALLVPAVAAADVDRFTVVNAATLGGSAPGNAYRLTIEGAVAPDGSALTASYAAHSDGQDTNKRLEHCHRVAMLVLSRPGKYTLEIVHERSGSSSLRGTLASCTLRRND